MKTVKAIVLVTVLLPWRNTKTKAALEKKILIVAGYSFRDLTQCHHGGEHVTGKCVGEAAESYILIYKQRDSYWAWLLLLNPQSPWHTSSSKASPPNPDSISFSPRAVKYMSLWWLSYAGTAAGLQWERCAAPSLASCKSLMFAVLTVRVNSGVDGWLSTSLTGKVQEREVWIIHLILYVGVLRKLV